MVPTVEHIELGIKEIVIAVKLDVLVFFHTPENFITAKPDTDMLQKHYIFLDHFYLPVDFLWICTYIFVDMN